jgi:hypothetical protein
MRRRCIALFLLVFLAVPSVAFADLEAFLNNLNVEARADMHGFSLRLSTQFDVPMTDVRVVLGNVATPADAFMCFELGRMARTPVQTVVRAYSAEKGKGWGNIAKSLGIKPGSAEFHALKRGDLVFNGEPVGETPKDKEKGKGKGKGHNK